MLAKEQTRTDRKKREEQETEDEWQLPTQCLIPGG
jgi:hypothetical protein